MPTTNTPNLNFPLVQAAQSQKHVTVNQSLQFLDAILHLSVESRNTTSPPEFPENGERYLIPSGATGDWTNHTSEIAIWQDNIWIFILPKTGWRVWAEDEAIMLVWTSGSWQAVPVSATEIHNLMQLGINAQADTNNKLYVKSDNITFETENQDIRCILNKDSASDTASVIMQSGATGHVEIGLTDDNDLHIKTSTDGSNWVDTLTINHTSGECIFHFPLSLPQPSKSNLPDASIAGRLIYVPDATGGPSPAYSDGSEWKRISDNSIIN